MLKNPRLKYHYRAEFLDHENVLLQSEKENILLCGYLYNLIISKIHKTGISVEELVKQLADQVTVIEIVGALHVLEEKGYITEACPTLSDENCAYWNSLGIEPMLLTTILEKTAVSVKCLGAVTDNALLHAFDSLGISTSDNGVIDVVITDDYDREELQRINQEALAAKHPWMLMKPVGEELWIGPIFVSQQTGCWECLVQRLRYNRQAYNIYMSKENSRPTMALARIAESSRTAAGIAALEVLKWLYFGKNEALEGKIFSIHAQSLTSCSHVLVKRPQCPVCGNPDASHPSLEPMVLRKNLSYCPVTLGGYREVPPEVTTEKYVRHVSHITGVVQKLIPYYRIADTPVHNYFSGQMVILQKMSPSSQFQPTFRSGCGGKGKTPSQAKAGALCEALERYSAMSQGDERTICASFAELGQKAIHPNLCMNYSENQYQQREQINRSCYRVYDMIPQPFDEMASVEWVTLYSLTELQYKYLPKNLCYLEVPVKDMCNSYYYPDSNGIAAGNSIEEAILQGFLELVERDSVALWWYNMLRKPAVDLLSFHDAYFYQLTEYFDSLNRCVYVLDLTSDLQIPAFGAVSYRLDDRKQEIVFGFGAHVDAKIAIERALLELNQILAGIKTLSTSTLEGKLSIQDQSFRTWLDTATIEDHPYLVPQENMPAKIAADYPQVCNPNVYDSIMFCLDTAAKNGLETLVLNMTRPDIGLPVVRVLVPGLRHFWKRLAPGRLYTVPVQMGWLEQPLLEEELNSVGLFI